MRIKLFPYDSFVVETSETVPQIVEKLSNHVEPRRFIYWLWTKTNKEFEGTVTGSRFKINRVIRYWNSFLPVMIGQFVARPEGTTVIIRMRLHGYTLALIVFFLAFMVKYTFDLIGPNFQFDTPFFWGLGVPGTFILAIYLMAIFGFSYEADLSRRLALKILLGESSN